MGGNRYIDLGLGTHRVKCLVHPDFRLIVIAEDSDVHDKFPIPLINRLEKHFLGMETMLRQGQLLTKFANFYYFIKSHSLVRTPFEGLQML